MRQAHLTQDYFACVLGFVDIIATDLELWEFPPLIRHICEIKPEYYGLSNLLVVYKVAAPRALILLSISHYGLSAELNPLL